jgi:hypothetical protein
MALIIDNDAVNFCEEFKKLCEKYVKSASIVSVQFKDGTSIGMRTLLEIGFGVKKIEDCLFCKN